MTAAPCALIPVTPNLSFGLLAHLSREQNLDWVLLLMRFDGYPTEVSPGKTHVTKRGGGETNLSYVLFAPSFFSSH